MTLDLPKGEPPHVMEGGDSAMATITNTIAAASADSIDDARAACDEEGASLDRMEGRTTPTESEEALYEVWASYEAADAQTRAEDSRESSRAERRAPSLVRRIGVRSENKQERGPCREEMEAQDRSGRRRPQEATLRDLPRASAVACTTL